MLRLLKEEANQTHTENGALTHATTNSDCLDLFSTIGALRSAPDHEPIQRFSRAWAEDRTLALKILFYARDIRGGLGERRIFRVLYHDLAQKHPETARNTLSLLPIYGRYDDLLTLLDTACQKEMLTAISAQLQLDITTLEQGGERLSLLAKWLPSVNASSAKTVVVGKRVARGLGMTNAQYRKTLSALRAKLAIIENNLRQRDYSFNYEKQPAKAMFQYRRAFIRNDGTRYCDFVQRVKAGAATLHTGTLYPYEVIAPYLHNRNDISAQEQDAIEATWNALPDFTTNENALVVVDGSGSMYTGATPSPASVALSLGLYFAQRNQGAFAGHFITFSERPRLVQIKGATLWEQVQYCASYNQVADTNIEKVFQLILNTAVRNNLPQSELPSTLYIVSDMEFNDCVHDGEATNFQAAQGLFAQHGYKLPRIVFWNVASRQLQQPVTQNEQGVALVSGCTPRLFEVVLSGSLSPYAYMLKVLGSDRYASITA